MSKPFVTRDLDLVTVLRMNDIVPTGFEIEGKNLMVFSFEETEEFLRIKNDFCYNKYNEFRRFCNEKKFIKSQYQLKAQRQNNNNGK